MLKNHQAVQPDLTAGQVAGGQAHLFSPDKRNAAHTDQHTLFTSTQQRPSTWLGINILIPNNCQEGRNCNYYSVTSVGQVTDKPPHICKSGLQVQFQSIFELK